MSKTMQDQYQATIEENHSLMKMLQTSSNILEGWNAMIARDGSDSIDAAKVLHANMLLKRKIDLVLDCTKTSPIRDKEIGE